MRVIVSVPTCALRSKRFASALQMLADKLMPRPSSPSSSKAAHLHTHPHQHASRLRMFACSEGNDYLGTGGGLIYALQRCYDAQQRSSAKSTSDTHKHDDVGATWLIKDDVDDDAPRPSATSSLLSTTWLQSEPRMVLLAGGQARRLPSYASLGKLLTPMPNNNNSNNNNINCYSSISLMEAQLPLLLRLRHVAPRHLTTLVACGDVLLAHHRDGDALDESLVSALAAANTPYDEEDVQMKKKQDDDDHDDHHEAEVLCVALQRGVNIATNHGVFFVDRRTRVLRYMKQKPTKEEIERCCSEDDADFFVDAGLWLLGDRAITYIQSQSMRHISSSSSSSSYSDAEHNTTSASRWTYHNYDLFGSFGSMFGTHPASSPSTPSPPWRVRIIVLGEDVCTFHHVGTNLDLLRSTMELLRRKSWMAEMLGKASSFTQQQCDGSWRIISQHAVISPLCTQNQYAPSQLGAATSICTCADAPSSLLPSWVESSWISRGWRITCGNIITGVPRNQWSITMAEHQCVAVLPLRPPPSCQTRDDVEWFAIRPYGLHDSFVAPRHTTTTPSVSSMDDVIFMNVPLSCWLQHHHLTIDDVLPISSSSSSSSVIDLHHLRLFPCSCDVPKLGQLLRWMLELPTSSSSSSATHLNDVDEVPMTLTERKQLAEVWRASPRISAADFSTATDVDRVLDQQVTMQEGADVLAALLRGDLDVAAAPSVNLLRAAADVVELAMPLPTWLLTQPPPPTTAASSSSSSSLLSTTVEMPPSVALAPSHLHMFASDVMQHVASSLANDDETASTSTPPTTPRRFSCSMIAAQDASMFHHRHAMDVLRTVVVNALPREGRVWPRRLSSPSSSPSSSLVVRCPARIDLAGGWTDTPPFSLLHGGCVLNTGICMNDTQPIHVRVDVLPQQPWIHVCSHDAHEELILSDYASIYTYATSLHTPFAIVKAALCLCGFHPTFADAPTRTLREQLMRDFDGHGLRLTMAANIPVGSGLGTSSIVAGAVLHALSSFTHLNWSTEDVCARVLALEQLLTTGGGWQDQFGGLMPGLKMVESCAGVHQRPRVRLLRHEVFSHPANASRCLLFFTGISRPASTILHEVVQNVLRHAPTQLDVLEEMQHVAHEMEAVINMTEDEVHPSQQLSRVGVLLRDSWRLNQRLSSRSSTTLVDAMLRAVDPWIDGAKLAGAGGGGFMLLIAKDDDDCVRMIRRTLTDMAADGYFVEMSVATKGIQHEWVRDATHLHTNG